MRNKSKSNASFYRRASLACAVLAGFFVVTTAAPPLRANEECQQRTAKIEHRLHEAIEHHGSNSPQADRWRHELHEQRERCWSGNHRWWDEHEHRWHQDRDWDEHDHDRDNR
jgi:hypothetical protein